MNRRSFLKSLSGSCALAMPLPVASSKFLLPADAGAQPLKLLAQEKGKILAMYSGQHQLMTDPTASRLIASEFDMLAIGNDLKMNRVHPQPDKYDFSYADWDIRWSEQNKLLFRGHTLVWHNALPSWFGPYVTKGNARRVMTDHIMTVVKHYAGRVYSWDVVNEALHNDGRSDMLRVKPWLDLVGPDYIELAFHTASSADPAAKLVLNECYIEHDVASDAGRRDALLQLATHLKSNHVPLHGIGIQGHLKADTPLAVDPMRKFLDSLKDLDLEILITELDVDDNNIPPPQVDKIVAAKYEQFLELVGPYAKVITFEDLADEPNLKRPDGVTHRPNLWDTQYQAKSAYFAAAKALNAMRH